jgi:hypothetical protein
VKNSTDSAFILAGAKSRSEERADNPFSAPLGKTR